MMEDKLAEKELEINKKNNDLKEIIKGLEEKTTELKALIENKRTDRGKLNYKLATINKDIESRKEQIDNITNEESATQGKQISFEEIKVQCNSVINTFIREIPFNNISHAQLRFKIKYGELNIMRLIEDENMDFLRLKQQTKIQFNKNENDFFFADENKNIYLDSLNVKKALFPLETVTIEKYEPTIILLDRYNNLEAKEEAKSNHLANILVTDDYKIKLNFVERLIESVKKNFRGWFHFLTFFFFIFCLISTSISFRNVKEYNNFVDPFKNGKQNFGFEGAGVTIFHYL
jgi:hypothetical protein